MKTVVMIVVLCTFCPKAGTEWWQYNRPWWDFTYKIDVTV
jgi:hypothetical protein